MSKDFIKKELYTIGEIAKVCAIPIRTLHYYNSIGLLYPAHVDPDSQYRYYSHDQIPDINTIKRFKVAGFSLKEMKVLLEKESMIETQALIREKCMDLEQRIQSLLYTKNRLEAFLANPSADYRNAEILVRRIPEEVVACSRYVGEATPDEFHLRFSKLSRIINREGLLPTGTMRAVFYGGYRDSDRAEMDIEICVPVPAETGLSSTVRLFGDELAVQCTHHGSHRIISQTYHIMRRWMDENHFVPVGRVVENYIIDRLITRNEDEFITEIFIPVKNFT